MSITDDLPSQNTAPMEDVKFVRRANGGLVIHWRRGRTADGADIRESIQLNADDEAAMLEFIRANP